MIDAREHFAKAMDEATLQQNVEDRARALGWTVYHARDSRKSEEGFPDVCAVRSGVLLYAELKSATGRLSGAQRVWLNELLHVSHRVACADFILTGTPAISIDGPEGWRDVEPAMHKRLVQVYVWRPLDLLDGTIDRLLEANR